MQYPSQVEMWMDDADFMAWSDPAEYGGDNPGFFVRPWFAVPRRAVPLFIRPVFLPRRRFPFFVPRWGRWF